MSDIHPYADIPSGSIWKVSGKRILIVPKYKAGPVRRFLSWVQGNQSLSTVFHQMIRDVRSLRSECYEDIYQLVLLKSNVILRWRDYRTKSGVLFRWLDGWLHHGSVRRHKDHLIQSIYEHLRWLFFGREPLSIPQAAFYPPGLNRQEAERRFIDATYQILTAPSMSLEHYEQTEKSLQSVLSERGGQTLSMWYRRLALLGFPGAHYRLACFYEDGSHDVPADWEKASVHYRSAAEGGVAEAQYRSAEALRVSDHHTSHDRELAVEWFEEAARRGHDWATLQLGVCYLEGWGVKQDLQLAAFQLQGLLGPERPDRLRASAAYHLGRVYELRHQYEEAAGHFLIAVELKHDQALSELALLGRSEAGREKGISPAYPEDPQPSGRLKPHYSDLFDVGWMFKQGILIPQDEEKAQSFFRRAAQLDQESPQQGHVHAQYEVGCHALEEGDRELARRALSYAAQQNHSEANKLLSKMDDELYPPAL